MIDRPQLLARAQQYANRKGLVLGKPLGSGVHGSVFGIVSQSGNAKSAVKAHESELGYSRERDVYFRLQEIEITQVREFAVPFLVDCGDELWILEITVVSRPFVLDFAGAFLDKGPEFPEDVLADWEAEKREQFGANWPEAKKVLRALESYGIFMIDVNPGNIGFAD